MLRGFIFTLTLLLHIMAGNAQLFTGRQSNSIVAGTQKVKLDEKTGFVEYFELSSSSLKSGVVIDETMLKQKTGLPQNYNLQIDSEQVDTQGNKHKKYQLYYYAIPVEGMGYSVHFKNGNAASANGKIIKTETSQTTPSISADDAIKKAISLFNAKQFIWDTNPMAFPEATLLYVPIDNALALCYKIDVYALQPLQREFVYIDAQTGEVVKRISRIHHSNYQGTAITQYSGTVEITTNLSLQGYVLNEQSRGNGIYTYTLNHSQYYTDASNVLDDDNHWDNPSDRVAYDAHYGAQKTYDYFFNKFGRNSLDNNGFALKSYVHYGHLYDNAFWDGERMTYGDGDGQKVGAFASLDIVGHEITHGLTSHTANLEYLNESGALNESFSDIFGIAIDFYANASAANYMLGEQIYLDDKTYMRNIANPKRNFQPNTYKGDFWRTGYPDHGGVHSNSMVQNYWFYLLCEGGNGINDKGSKYMVEAIGIEAAEAIAFRNLTVYLSRYSDYNDARYYSIQSAIDLFGDCSNEVIQVTNAWYAVGVGARFNNAVSAAFMAEITSYCGTPAVVELQNISNQAQTYTWYLNGQEFSADENPTLTINYPGKYDIKLAVSGTSGCNVNDESEIKKYISVSNDGSPIPALHQPTSIQKGSGGIYSVQLNQIDHQSRGATEGYSDFTCGHQTVLTEGKKYKLSVRTSTDFAEALGVWLDINNDGLFSNPSERLFTSMATAHHTADIKIPAGLTFDTPLRLRVGSDRYDYRDSLDAQKSSQYGQYEDYTVVLQKNIDAPLAMFTMSDTLAFSEGNLKFKDVSENIVTTRTWHFEGGQPEYSSDFNPTVTYLVDGKYNVKLTVTNAFGSSTSTKQIRVATNFMLGVHTHAKSASGYIYDSGGENGSYAYNSIHKFIIEPICAKEVLLTIEAFETESCCDGLKIYDGKNENAPLLASLKGMVDAPLLIKAYSGSMFLVFSSDESVSFEGFRARWNTVFFDAAAQVKADFNVEDELLPVNFDLQFTDNSLPKPSIWNWDFGNGNTSSEQHPKYSYTNPGSYEVLLAVDNCVSKDTLKKQIVISAAPQLSVTTDTIVIDLRSGQRVDGFISIDNLNNGLLAYAGELKALYQKGNHDKLIKYFASAREYDGLKVGLARNVFFYPLKGILTSKGAVCIHITEGNLSDDLNSLDVLIVDDSADFLTLKKDEIREWVHQGGFLIVQGDGIIAKYNDLLQGTGIHYEEQVATAGVAVLLSHKITDSINQYEIGSNAECILKVATPAVRLINDQMGNCYSALAEWGKGKILTMSDESFQYIDYLGHQEFLNNALNYCVTTLNPSVCNVEKGYSFISGISTDSLKYQINASRLVEGEYVADIQVNNNDILLGSINIPVLLKITGREHIESDVCILNFDFVPIHTEKIARFNIKNTGTRSLSISHIGSSSDAFSVDFSPIELTPGQEYTLDVTFAPNANKNYNESLHIHSSDPDSPIYSIALEGTAGVISNLERNDLNTSVRIYPNPASAVLYVEADDPIDTVELLNISGRNLEAACTISYTKAQINMSSLQHGVYVVKIRTTGKEMVCKVVKR